MKLPNFLCPKHKCELIRLGQKNDGGYSIPKKSLENSEFIFGFGLSDDWSFEKDFRKLSGAKVVCYDLSVNGKYWIIRFCKDLINMLLLRKGIFSSLKRFFTYFKYKLFFDGKNKIHEKKIIAPINQRIHGIDRSNITDLNQILSEKDNFNFFLKVDIEKHEYRILEQIIKYQERLTGLAIEFHDCDFHFDKIKNFINNFKLQLVHVHINNYGDVNAHGFATVIELTFSPHNYNTLRETKDNKFPVAELDQPNNKNRSDEIIIFE
tara:strand:+ start:231 stop:1025 length:795 start_codon:yes stop_codon:yes gene_type:complete